MKNRYRDCVLQAYREAGYNTLHKIALSSYKQRFGTKNAKRRGFMTNQIWDGNLN